ncbi:hypothetical protein G1K46_04865 [Tenacibaculum finnmarkense]|uniref:hypothetical protein n=5 Tax=Tenacibaculum finnmarkense TaxID=2781243 RepID=UPI001EFB47D7|nr:hypothetical protein [Tenacibaculum finnmarkense]MCG8762069.1 hypothetical protein [Tenacibaculum finnmarkense]MCG8787445.1 hypothetical protein [Tenacibaculum finnmarkense]
MKHQENVKKWFETHDKPSEQQFYNFFKWIRWIDENISVQDIEGLNKLLIAKADKQAFNTHLQDEILHPSENDRENWNGKLDKTGTAVNSLKLGDKLPSYYVAKQDVYNKQESDSNTVSAMNNVITNFSLNNFNSIKDTNQLILETFAGDWDENIRENGNVIKVGNALVQVYSGHQGSYNGNNVYIGIATSTDEGQTWVKGNNNGNIIPIHSMEDGYIIYRKSNSTYYLYAENKQEVPFKNIICWSSTDLINWTNEGIVLDTSVNLWENQDVSSPALYYNELLDNITLIYEGRGVLADGTLQGGAIGLATSSNFTTFTRSGDAPIFSGKNINAESNWCSHLVPDDVVKYQGVYYLSYHGYSIRGNYFAAGFATSTNLAEWKDYGQIIIESNLLSEGQDVMFYPGNDDLRFITSRGGKRHVGVCSTFKVSDLNRFLADVYYTARGGLECTELHASNGFYQSVLRPNLLEFQRTTGPSYITSGSYLSLNGGDSGPGSGKGLDITDTIFKWKGNDIYHSGNLPKQTVAPISSVATYTAKASDIGSVVPLSNANAQIILNTASFPRIGDTAKYFYKGTGTCKVATSGTANELKNINDTLEFDGQNSMIEITKTGANEYFVCGQLIRA